MAHPNSPKGRLEIELRQVRDIMDLHKFRQRVWRDTEVSVLSALELDRLALLRGDELRHILDAGSTMHSCLLSEELLDNLDLGWLIPEEHVHGVCFSRCHKKRRKK